MQHAFRPWKGEWVIKEHTVAASAAAIEAGDMMQVTSGGITIALGTATATAIIGIAAEDSATSTSTRTLRVWEPNSKRATFIGRVTDGAIAAGDTDSGRTCDLEDHEGADTDTDTHHHLIIVKGRVAAADGSVGEAEFRIAQDLENLNSF
jgi:hypothetical protein